MKNRSNQIDREYLKMRPRLWSLIKNYCSIQYEEYSNDMTIDDHAAELQHLMRINEVRQLRIIGDDYHQ